MVAKKTNKQYYEVLLNTAMQGKYLFVATFASTDFDKLVKQLPSGQVREIAKIWQYTGLTVQKRQNKKSTGDLGSLSCYTKNIIIFWPYLSNNQNWHLYVNHPIFCV